MKAIDMPYPFFVDLDGNPLDNGKIYVGIENENPVIESKQVQVWADLAGTIPLSQPIRTSFGYPARYGRPVNIFVNSSYSIVVRDANDELILSEPSSSALVPASGAGNAVDDYGAIGDGTGDNGDIFNEIFGGSVTGRVFIPAGTYNTDSLLVIDCEDLEVWGVEGATIITSNTLQELSQVVRMDNVHFYGITFQLTTTSGLASSGIVFGDSPEITDSSFTRCTFSAPNNTAGGFILSGTDSAIQGFRFFQCKVQDVGGKGIYIESGNYNDLYILFNSVENTGLYVEEDGDGITIGDGGQRAIWVSQNRINNVSTNVFKIGQVSNATISDNRIGQISRDCNFIDSPDTLLIKKNITVTGNMIDERLSNGGVSIFGWENCKFSNNNWLMTDRFSMTDCVHIKSTNDTIDTTDVNAIYITGDSTNNEWIGGIITNASAVDGAGNATILTDGADVENNRAVSVEIYKTSSGQLVDSENSADDISLVYCSGDASTFVDGQIYPWTPVVAFSGSDVDVAYTAGGTFCKIGSLVNITFSIEFTNKGSGSGTDYISISGFPNTVYDAAPAMRGGVSCFNYNFLNAISGDISGLFFSNSITLYQAKYTSTAQIMLLTRADLTNNSFLGFSGFFFTEDI